MSIFPDDIEQVYDKVTEHKLRQTHQRMVVTMKSGLPVIFCQFRSSLPCRQ